MKIIKDVAIIGAGISGLATAARLQAQGLSTITLEAHGRAGGCAGYYQRKGFSFDVGATTLVDFEADGVGGELLDAIGMPLVQSEQLPGYMAWLPDRVVVLHRNKDLWAEERLKQLGASSAHQAFWKFLDQLASVFWAASRKGIKLPMQSLGDIVQNSRSLGLHNLPLGIYLNWTMGDALRKFGLRDDKPLCGLLAMLIEDTVHSTLDDAPLINAALGVSIRGAGLSRYSGGMYGFWKQFTGHYRKIGGDLKLACRVKQVLEQDGLYFINSSRGDFFARQIVSSLPPETTARIAPPDVQQKLSRYTREDKNNYGGAMVLFLGVPEAELNGQSFTHHQLLHDYNQPLGNGNNMFISVSSPGDTKSAPEGYRAVMISTHCELDDWENLSEADYAAQKDDCTKRLIEFARRVYPNLASNPLVCELGTPHSYEFFTSRPRGAVGGMRLNLGNSNQNAIPQNIGAKGFYLVGDNTWPGLGTVACVLGSRIAADLVLKSHQPFGGIDVEAARVFPSLRTS